MDNNYCVYKHTFPNEKVYIGITCQKPERRWRNGNGYSAKKQRLMNHAIKKYGWDNIKHEILFDGLTKNDAEQKEIELITKYKSNKIDFGYNVEGGGNATGKISDETKQKIGNANRGRVVSQETREKLSIAGKGRTSWNKGKPAWNRGMSMTKESKEKLSNARKGRYTNEDNPFYGRTHTEEAKRKISEKAKSRFSNPQNNPFYGKHHTEETKSKMRKKIVCVETGIIYQSLKDAEEKTCICIASISSVLHGRQKTAGGYHWEFVGNN